MLTDYRKYKKVNGNAVYDAGMRGRRGDTDLSTQTSGLVLQSGQAPASPRESRGRPRGEEGRGGECKNGLLCDLT